MNNYYEILNLDIELSQEELKTEMNKVQKKWMSRQSAHNLNKRQEAERMMDIIQEAEKILYDEQSRKEYNQKISNATFKHFYQIETELREELLDYLASDDEDFVEYLLDVISKDTLSVNTKDKTIFLNSESGKIIKFTSPMVISHVMGSLESYQKRKDFYQEMKDLYQEKLKEDYSPEEMARFHKEIEEKAKPSTQEEWLRQLTRNILHEDKDARDFVRINLRIAKGIDQYLKLNFLSK